MADIPYELKRYIEEEQERAGEANACDHKPTYQGELDRIAEEAKKEFERGKKLLGTISEEDLARCRRLFASRGGAEYQATKLAQLYIGKKFVVVPRYVGLIEEVRKLREVLR